jgi:peptidoglycan/xylan/chitin deacetylase (PgdA/CDA1 family)
LAGLRRHHLLATGFVTEGKLAGPDRVWKIALLAWRGRRPRWFRHPYLETGVGSKARATCETWPKAHGYRVAPVTMENSDWMFALPYDDAAARRTSRNG